MAIPSRTVGLNVISLLGFSIREVLELRDNRGAGVAFQASIRGESVVEVRGTRTVFGLVLHRIIIPAGAKLGWRKWTISEPVTGCAIASGCTRQDALDDLALRVAYFGGEAAFRTMLETAVLQHQAPGARGRSA